MPVRRVTVEHRDWQIRKFATTLVRMGRDPATLNSLRDLVEIDTFKAGLLSILALQDSKRSVGLTDLAGSLKAIARHHVGVDEKYLERMRFFIRKRLDPKQHGLAKKNRDRLRQFDEPENFITLLQLPPKLMRLATKCKVPRPAALLAQMAVAIEILWFISPRVSNLVNLDLKRNLYRPVRSKCLYIVIDADEVKNREPLEHALSEESTALIELYIRVFRPNLPGAAASTALFPSRKGGPRRKIAFGQQISRLIYAHTGLVVNPHLFRHLTSTAYLDENPNAGELVRRRLGHRSINTVQKYYLGQTSKPFRHFDDFLLRLRREAAAANKVRRGKNDEQRNDQNSR
jgi:integrase